jgi:hypothetical protein
MGVIPREVFTLGAVQLDTSRLANLEGQLLAKREAKQKAEDEAFDKYFSEKQKIYQEKGVRPIDQKGFLDRVQKWKDFSIANKSQIAKNPLIRSQADNLYMEAFNWAQNSSQATDKLKPYEAMLLDRNKRREMNTEMVMDSIDKHNKSLDDPDRQEIKTNDAWFKPPEYDFNKAFKEAAQGQEKSFLGKIPGSTDYQLGKLKIEEGYSPDAIKQIATDFARSVADNPANLDYWQRQADKDMPAGEVVRLNELLKPYFPDLKVSVDNPIALAMAKAIERASVKRIDLETDAALANQRAMARKASDGGTQVNLYDYDVLGKYEPEQKVTPDNPIFGIKGFTEDVVYVKDIPSEDLELITNNGAVNPITDQGVKYFKVRADGNWEGARGQVIDKSSVARSNLDKISLAEEKRLKQGIIKPKLPAAPKAKKGELD